MSQPSTLSKLTTEVQYTLLRVEGHVLHITLNRPHVLNALHPPAHAELDRIFDAFASDPTLWIAVISGTGERGFCTGTDLKVHAELGRDEFPPTGFAGFTHRFDLDKPVIAAVNGLALGGGLEVALAADIVIAADHAEFGFPEPRVGLAALGGGGIQRLVRQIPYKQAMGMLLTGRRISAVQACNFGFVNQVVPLPQLHETVEQWLADMLACAPLALQAAKQVARRNLDYPTLPQALQGDYPAAEAMLTSDDAKEGIQAFIEKREPKWSGQ